MGAKRIAGRQYYASGRIRPLARDYHAEEIRRNALALNRSKSKFRTRAAQRKAIETGNFTALQPYRVTSARTRKAQTRRLAWSKLTEDFTDEMRAQDWSMLNAKTEMARYMPERANELGYTKEKYLEIYIAAFVIGDFRYTNKRHKGGSYALYEWFVTLNHFMTEDEYTRRYGKGSGRASHGGK